MTEETSGKPFDRLSKIPDFRTRDFFAELGVKPEATDTEIKTAYKKAASLFHSDKVAETEKEFASKQFQKVKEAYEVLSDPAARAKYESERGFYQRQPAGAQATSSPPKPEPEAKPEPQHPKAEAKPEPQQKPNPKADLTPSTPRAGNPPPSGAAPEPQAASKAGFTPGYTPKGGASGAPNIGGVPPMPPGGGEFGAGPSPAMDPHRAAAAGGEANIRPTTRAGGLFKSPALRVGLGALVASALVWLGGDYLSGQDVKQRILDWDHGRTRAPSYQVDPQHLTNGQSFGMAVSQQFNNRTAGIEIGNKLKLDNNGVALSDVQKQFMRQRREMDQAFDKGGKSFTFDKVKLDHGGEATLTVTDKGMSLSVQKPGEAKPAVYEKKWDGLTQAALGGQAGIQKYLEGQSPKKAAAAPPKP